MWNKITLATTTKASQVHPEKETIISRRKFVIFLAILFGIIIAFFALFKEMGIKIINQFRIRSVEEPPRFDPATWKLVIDGLVDMPLVITYDELLKLESEEEIADFHCVEGWAVNNVKWKGVRLKVIFDRAGLRSDAAFATFYSSSGIYSDSLSIKEALEPDVMLAYMMDDQMLSQEHGKPLRLVMPRMFGYKNVKWVNRITLTGEQDTGYWERFGYKIDGVSYP